MPSTISVPRGRFALAAQAALGVALALNAAPLLAVDAVWTADATTGYLWDDAANWSTNVVPTGADAVILPALIPESGAAAEITLGSDEQAASVRFRNRYALLLGSLAVPALSADMGVTGRITSQLTGSGGLTKAGGGAIRLANAANDYTGLTTIANGSIIISSGGALGTDTSTVTVTGSVTRGFGGGSLVLDGTTTPFTLSRNLALTGYGPIAHRSAALISVGSNTLSGSVGIAQGLVNTRVTSAFGQLTFAGTTTANGTAGTHFSVLGGTNQAGVGQYAITGLLAGTGTLEKSGSGMLLLAPSSSAGFSGNFRISTSATGTQSSVRILSNGVLGTNTVANSGSNVLDFNGGILVVRMDSPVLTSGGAAANSYLRASSTLFVDHAPGGTALNGTLTLGQQYFEDNQTLTLNSRNGYGFTFGAAPVNGGENNSTITNNLGGTLTYTGTFWSNGNGTSRTMTIGGNGNTVISGNVTASSTTAGADHSLTKTGTGSLTITSTAATLDGNLNANGGAVVITDFRSVNMHAATTTNNGQINIGTGTTAGNLIIGTATTPTAAGLTTSKTIDLAATTAATAIYANQPGSSPVILNGPITATGGGAKILTLAGTNTAGNIVNGIIANNTGTNTTAVTKFGTGTWILAGANT